MSDVFPANHLLLKLFAENIWGQISIKNCKNPRENFEEHCFEEQCWKENVNFNNHCYLRYILMT